MITHMNFINGIKHAHEHDERVLVQTVVQSSILLKSIIKTIYIYIYIYKSEKEGIYFLAFIHSNLWPQVKNNN